MFCFFATAFHPAYTTPIQAIPWQSIRKHRARVTDLEFHPSGRFFASAGFDSMIYIYSLLAEEIIDSLDNHSDRVKSLSFSPDGNLLASGGYDNSLILWSTNDWVLVDRLVGVSDCVSSLHFSPDSRLIVSGSDAGDICVIYTKNGHRYHRFRDERRFIYSLDINPVGSCIASAGINKDVILWSLEKKSISHRFETPARSNSSVNISPAGDLIAASGSDNIVRIWDIDSGEIVKSLKSHKAYISSIEFSPDGRFLATASDDRKVRFFDVTDDFREVLKLTQHNAPVNCISFSPTGEHFASGDADNRIILWRLYGVDPMIKIDTTIVIDGEDFIDTTGPDVRMIDPVFNTARIASVLNENIVTLQGEVNDSSGFDNKLLVNEYSIGIADARFSCDIPLVIGENKVRIRVKDRLGNRTDEVFRIFRVDEEADIAPPEIAIIEPEFSADGIATVENVTRVRIRGRVKDKSGIKGVWIDDREADLNFDGTFSELMMLRPGNNVFTIKAQDDAIGRNKNETIQPFTIVSIQEVDLEGPLIELIEPAQDYLNKRGMQIIRDRSLLHIRGRASDKSGISYVSVNKKEVNVALNGEFTCDLNLQMGINTIVVVAIDGKKNSNLREFYAELTLKDDLSSEIRRGRYIAMIIGIDAYSEWSPLNNAVRDARAFAAVLQDEYYFEIIDTLFNEDATQQNIINRLQNFAKEIEENDNFLIYFSGHGHFDKITNIGYWVPVKGSRSEVYNYISNSSIKDYVEAIKSKHTLIIADACFAAAVFRGEDHEPPSERTDKWFRSNYRQKSRTALTSGGLEKVDDGPPGGHSLFCQGLLNCLTNNEDKYLDAGALYQAVKFNVSSNLNQTPMYNPIRVPGHENGEFIFIRK